MIELVFVSIPVVFSLILLIRLEKEHGDIAIRTAYAVAHVGPDGEGGSGSMWDAPGSCCCSAYLSAARTATHTYTRSSTRSSG